MKANDWYALLAVVVAGGVYYLSRKAAGAVGEDRGWLRIPLQTWRANVSSADADAERERVLLDLSQGVHR